MIPPGALSFGLSWWKAGVGVLIGAALVFPLGQCSGVKIQKDRAAAASVKVIQRSAAASETAAEQRGKDAAAAAETARGRLDATQGIPDESPGAVRRAYNCKRLRDAEPAANPPAGC